MRATAKSPGRQREAASGVRPTEPSTSPSPAWRGNGSHNNEPGKLPPARRRKRCSIYTWRHTRRKDHNNDLARSDTRWGSPRTGGAGVCRRSANPPPPQAVSRIAALLGQDRGDRRPTCLEPHHSLVKEHRSRLAARSESSSPAFTDDDVQYQMESRG